jgi:hypothetical protein
MPEYREEVVRKPTPDGVVEERVVVEPAAERIVERVVEQPVVERVVEQPVVERVVQQPVAVAPTRQVVRRWWRREPAVVPTTDVVSTEYYTAPGYSYDPTLAQFLRVMWFMLGLLEGVLALRFLLAMMAANPRNAFASLVYGLTGPFVAPFRTLFPTPAADGSVVELYTLIAMLVYFLAWWTIVKLIGVVTNRPVDV